MRFQDGHFTLFPNDDIIEESEYVDVLQNDAQGNNVVSRVLVDALESEAIVLMRAGATSTNSIIPEANKLMGKSAQNHRENQREWKRRLRERINAVGIEAVHVELNGMGVTRPYARNWSRDHLIRPLSDHNFTQLLDYLKFSEIEKMAIFNSARAIRSAHQRAGIEITKSLKDAFAHIDFEEIYNFGSYSIKLEGDDEVMVVALIFEELGESLVKARISQTRKLWAEPTKP